MEDLPKHIEKEISELTPSKRSTKTKCWTLLLVGDHGEIISVNRFAGVAVTAIVVLILAVATAIVLHYLYQGLREDNKKLQEDLKVSQQVAFSLRNEKDILMARLVVAESKIADDTTTAEKTPTEKTIPASPVQKPPAKTTSHAGDDTKKTSINGKQTDNESAPDKTRESVQETKPPSVAVENLILFNEAENNTLHVQFKLVNTGQNSQPVSGRAFVVLKENEVNKDAWLAFPSVNLTSGKPSQIYKGQYFSIARFKPMNFEKKIQVNLERFKRATVFVFTTAGELLLEKNLPIKIKENVELLIKDP